MRILIAVLLALYVCACGSPTSPSIVSGGSGTNLVVQPAAVDLPPVTQNQCPHDAPTEFDAKPDAGRTPTETKFTFDWRRTGPTNNYILDVRKREQNGTVQFGTLTLDPRENGTLPTRYFPNGVYHFRLRGNCGPESRWSAEVVRGGAFGPDVPTPPPTPPPPVCVQTTGETVPPTCK